MSLVDKLLAEEFETPTARTPKGKSNKKGPVPKRTPIQPQESVGDRLRESVNQGRGITLSLSEAREIIQIVENSEIDPFSYGGQGKINTQDLRTLGLKISTTDDEDDLDDPFGDGVDPEEDVLDMCYGTNGNDTIPVAAAVTAPEATPRGDEDIPAEVMQTIMALMSDDDEEPIHDATKLRDAFKKAGNITPGEEQEEPEPTPGVSSQKPRINIDGNTAVEIRKRVGESMPARNVHQVNESKAAKAKQERAAKEADFLARIGNLGG